MSSGSGTWVSRPIQEDRPSDQKLFGEFYNTETLSPGRYPGHWTLELPKGPRSFGLRNKSGAPNARSCGA